MTTGLTKLESGEDILSPPSRGEVLGRYRHLRAMTKEHANGAARCVSKDAFLSHAKRLGLLRGKTFLLEHEDELALVNDLAIYTASPGRTRAIERYARTAKVAPQSEEEFVLRAMCNSRFVIGSAKRRHEIAGLVIEDVFRKRDFWLIDEGMERTLPDGALLAFRCHSLGDYCITAGACVLVDIGLLRRAFEAVPALNEREPAESLDDRRLAEAIYREVLASGAMQGMRYEDPG